MYKVQAIPLNGTINGHKALATLRDEYGGVYHIAIDDHCAILIRQNGGENGGEGVPSGPRYHGKIATHWFPEAVDALKSLPTPEYA